MLGTSSFVPRPMKERGELNKEMLSQKEAMYFVTEVLKIPRPVESKQENPHDFLSRLIVAFHQTIPFQSMSLLAVKPEDRHKPTLQETKLSVMSGKGGLCYSLNPFMKFLLEALGYDVYFVSSDIKHPSNHIITVVQNLRKPGDKYLVDVGIGYPTFEAIPLDFEYESPVYMHSFLQYKFVREGNAIVRWHGKGGSMPGVMIVNGWRKICIIDPTPKTLEFFNEPMNLVYTDPCITPFHTSLRVAIFRGLKATCIKDMSLLLEDDGHTLQETKFADYSALLDTIKKLLHLLAIDAVQNVSTGPQCQW